MTTLKSTAKTGRRSFMWKAGAALSAGLAATVPGMARTNANEQDLKRRLARLKDEHAIRELHGTYEKLLDSGRYREIADLFTDNAEVLFNGGIYRGKKAGVSRLYRDYFSAGKSGRKMEPAPGFQIDAEQQRYVIEFSENGKSARARFPYSIQLGAPMNDDSVLVKMARLHGEGIRKWWEGGVYDIRYVKAAKDGSWMITRLEHRVLARAVSVAPFEKVYPEDPTGPDKLVT